MSLKFFAGAALVLALVGPAAVAAPPAAALPNFADLYEQASPAVVAIRGISKSENAQVEREDEKFLNQFLPKEFPAQRRSQSRHRAGELGAGAGFLLSADGFVLTTDFVVADADQVLVTLADGRVFKARVVGVDAPTNVALLKIDGAGLPFLRIGDSTRIRTGEWVLAIGAPFKFANSISAGIISYKSRETGDYLALIQSDLMLNPGSAGGPLMNLEGDVIGVNAQIYTASGTFSGLAFSMPINDVMQVVGQLKLRGRVIRGKIGIEVGRVGSDDDASAAPAPGALVLAVEKGGPAERAGLKAGDVILALNGHKVADENSLTRMVGGSAVGSRVLVTVARKGVLQELPVSIAEIIRNGK